MAAATGAVMAGTKAGSKTYVVIVATVAAISGLLFGFDTAVINGALVFLRRQFALTDFQTEMAASALLLGCLIGAAGGGTLSDRIGRRKSLLLAALLFAASSLGAALARGLVDFSGARFVGGLAIGVASALTPVYISEVSPACSRGRLVSLNQLAIVLGILAAYFVNWRLSTLGESSWRWMFAVGVVPSVALLLGLLVVPESPRWLITRGRADEGRAILARISSSEAAVDAEVHEIEEAEREACGSVREIFSPALRGRLLIAIMLAVLQQISGINTVLYYGSLMFTEHFSGASATAAIGANVLVGAVNFLCTIVAMLFIDRLGRRALLLAASGGMTLCLAALVLAFNLPIFVPALAFTSILLYVGCFALGLGPGVWVYMAEIFPTNVRGRAMSVATSALWTACLAVTLTFLSIMHATGISGAFALYAVLSLCTFLFVWKWVPETRGKSLEQIQRMWGR